MTLPYILAAATIALLIGFVLPGRWRGWLMLVASALAVYILQPATPIRGLDFWLPTAVMALAICGWLVTTPHEARGGRSNLTAGILWVAIAVAVDLTRYLGAGDWIQASRPPHPAQALTGLLLTTLVLFLAVRFLRTPRVVAATTWALISLIITLLIVIKAPAMAAAAAGGLRIWTGQMASLATAGDLRWLGFSYVAFRLIHTLRDRQSGRLPAVNLREYITYVIFFPSFTAGPIDRIERFLKELRQPPTRDSGDLGEAARRLLLGMFSKFVLADTLALFALGGANAIQTRGAGWLWLMVYAYSLQVYFDFSGYTSIAIGLGRLMGFQLPENFNSPYLKPNLTQFWNNWHITLTMWFRAYFFNPLTRALRSGNHPAPAVLVMLLTQLSTMVLIGLWHGVSWNFAAWGAWHGLGLFLQNRYSEYMRLKVFTQPHSPAVLKLMNGLGALLTFHFVTLGWVWFALPDIGQSLIVFQRLFGLH
ncbi:MAG: MBOAT family O-acyltransferase [Anaerolineaceae bacterium]